MKKSVALPVTVKCRLGIDDQDTEATLDRFIDIVAAAGTDALIVHARKAWLAGLSPRENRTVPPLDHARVHRLKERLGNLPVILNGGIATIEEAKAHLPHVDGVMMGRAAYENPGQLLAADPLMFGAPSPAENLPAALEKLFPYIEAAMAEDARLNSITRHLLGLFRGQPGARAFRRHLAIEAVKPGAGTAVLREALGFVLDSGGELAQTAA
jgi:tRNA-dihydrouridine synthase A